MTQQATSGVAGKGYARGRSPPPRSVVVDGSIGLDRAHGVGAGQRRQRGQVAQSNGQGHPDRRPWTRRGGKSRPTKGRPGWTARASNGSRRKRSDICRNSSTIWGTAAIGRTRSNGSRSPKATGAAVRWGFRRSRTGSCRRLSKWSSSRSLKRNSGRAATASARDTVAKDALREVDRLLKEGSTATVPGVWTGSGEE